MMRFFQHENVLSCLDILQVGWSHLPICLRDSVTLWYCDTMLMLKGEGGVLALAVAGDTEL